MCIRDRYTGASINAPDLRAGAALVIAALAAEGMSVIDDIRYICLLYTSYDPFSERYAERARSS